jgi:hypothetical protein
MAVDARVEEAMVVEASGVGVTGGRSWCYGSRCWARWAIIGALVDYSSFTIFRKIDRIPAHWRTLVLA